MPRPWPVQLVGLQPATAPRSGGWGLASSAQRPWLPAAAPTSGPAAASAPATAGLRPAMAEARQQRGAGQQLPQPRVAEAGGLRAMPRPPGGPAQPPRGHRPQACSPTWGGWAGEAATRCPRPEAGATWGCLSTASWLPRATSTYRAATGPSPGRTRGQATALRVRPALREAASPARGARWWCLWARSRPWWGPGRPSCPTAATRLGPVAPWASGLPPAVATAGTGRGPGLAVAYGWGAHERA